jgi:PiT family inorganic phosphate transporter
MSPTPLTLTLLAVLLLAYANGTNDISKAIATLVGGKVADYRKAVLWGVLWTIAGAWLGGTFAAAMVKTFTTGILSEAVALPPHFPLAVTLGALSWVLFASWAGLPVSTTHALIGAICGAALITQGEGGIFWSALAGKVAIPLAASPLLALLVTLGLFPVVRHTLPIPDIFHWLSSGLVSFARGLSDAPKMVALAVAATLVTGEDPLATWAVFLLVALAMGMGSLWGGLRVTKRLAEKVTDLDPIEGLTASLTTAFLVTIAAGAGLPVSTTYVSSGAIIGVGLREGRDKVQWRTVKSLLLAWVVTLPAAGGIAALGLWGLPFVM